MSLLERLLKAGSSKFAAPLGESTFFNDKDSIPTRIPSLNIALSGSIDGGVEPGLITVAGKSKHFKTGLGLVMVRAYLDKYPDAVCMLFDSEFGITPEYISSNGIDVNRVLHIPIEHIEQLKFDCIKRLEEINRGDHVIIFVDSVGNLASKKEVDDAKDEKSAADFTRAKQLKSFFRMVTPHLTMKDIPMIVINHTYDSIEMFSKPIVGGGTGSIYSSNTVLIIGRQQEKDSEGEIEGWNFILNIEKSRKVKEKAKLPILVRYDNGISRTSGLVEIATELKLLVSPTKGWYSFVDIETGEIIDKKYRAKDLENFDIWQPLLTSPKFKAAIEKKYKVSYNAMQQDEETSDD